MTAKTTPAAALTFNSPLPKMQATFEKMKPFEVKYAKDDVREAMALAEVLREKWLASLTPEQRATYAALNTAHMLEEEFYPEHVLEGLRDGLVNSGQVLTLAKVREDCGKVKTALLGFKPLTFQESSARQKADEAALVAAAAN